MSKISLNIYCDDKITIDRTYTAEGFNLMMGMIDDFVEVIDIDKLNDEKAIAIMIVKAYGKVKYLLQDIFPELTDEDWKHIKITDLVAVIIDIGKAIGETFGVLMPGNLKRA